MQTIDRPIDHFLASQLSDAQLEHMNRFDNLIRKEILPDDPPIPFDEALKDLRNLPDFIEVEFWFIWNAEGDAIIAKGEGDIFHTGDNEHMLDFNIRVLPEARRCGYAKILLPILTAFARTKNRSLMITATSDRIPAGAVFMEKLGAERGLEMHMNQLCVSELDRGLIQTWAKEYAHLENKFEVVFLDGAYPESELTKIADMFQEVANDQPRDNLKMEDMIITPDYMRQMEKNTFATGTERWTIYLRERSTGIVAGLTEVYYNTNREKILNQGFTGVQPAYRNQGLGRWLKALMMNKILEARPQVEFIRTGNANSNAPMLKINHELGFKPYIARTVWQIETDKAEAYLTHQS